MHPITFDTSELASYMQRASKIAPTRPSLAILGNVHIAHDAQSATLTTTDLGVTIEQTLQSPSPSQEPIELCMPVADLAAFVNAALGSKAQQITITPTASGATLKAGARPHELSARLQTEDPAMFPQQYQPEAQPDPYVLTMPAQELARALGYGGLSRATDDSRPVLASVCMRSKASDPGLLFVDSADGFSVSRYTLDPGPEQEPPEALQALMPGPLHKQLVDLLKVAGPEEQAQLQISAHFLRASLGDLTLSGRLIDGTFPDFDEILKKLITPDMPQIELAGADLGRGRALAALCMLHDSKAQPAVMHVHSGAITLHAASHDKYVSLALSDLAQSNQGEAPESPGPESPAWIAGMDMARLAPLIGGHSQIVMRYAAQRSMFMITTPQQPAYFAALSGLATHDMLGFQASKPYATNKAGLDRAAAKNGNADQGDLFPEEPEEPQPEQEQAA